MATKKFIIEVEEGNTECNDNCPFREYGEICKEIGWGSKKEFNCNKYNFATMKMTEYNEPTCYDMQCLGRNPHKKEEEK